MGFVADFIIPKWVVKEPGEFYKLASKLMPGQLSVDVPSIRLLSINPLNDNASDD